MQPLYTKRFMEIAAVYVKENTVLKRRPGYEDKSIEELKDNHMGIIEEIDGKLYCYFKEEQKRFVEDVVEDMNTIRKRNDFSKYIVYK